MGQDGRPQQDGARVQRRPLSIAFIGLLMATACQTGEAEREEVSPDTASTIPPVAAEASSTSSLATECLAAELEYIVVESLDVSNVVPADVAPQLRADFDNVSNLVYSWVEPGVANDFREVIVRVGPSLWEAEFRSTPEWAEELGFPQDETLPGGLTFRTDIEFREGLFPSGVTADQVDVWLQFRSLEHPGGAALHVASRGIEREALLALSTSELVDVEAQQLPDQELLGSYRAALDTAIGLAPDQARAELASAGVCVEGVEEFPVLSAGEQPVVMGAVEITPGVARLDIAVPGDSDSSERCPSPVGPANDSTLGLRLIGFGGTWQEAVIVETQGATPSLTADPHDFRAANAAVGIGQTLAWFIDRDGQGVADLPSGPVEFEVDKNSLVATVNILADGFASMFTTLDGAFAEIYSATGSRVTSVQLAEADARAAVIRSIALDGQLFLGMGFVEGAAAPERWVMLDADGTLTALGDVPNYSSIWPEADAPPIVLTQGVVSLGDGVEITLPAEDADWNLAEIAGRSESTLFVVDLSGTLHFVDLVDGSVTQPFPEGCGFASHRDVILN